MGMGIKLTLTVGDDNDQSALILISEMVKRE